MDNNNGKKNEIKIELTPEVANGHYANLAMIVHSPNEFFMDFIAACAKPAASQGSEPYNHDSRKCETTAFCPARECRTV